MTTTITLDHPIEIEGETIQTLTMRRPRVRDDLAKERGGTSAAAQEVQFFADLCGVKAAVIKELDLADYAKLGSAYTGFFQPSEARSPKENTSGG